MRFSATLAMTLFAAAGVYHYTPGALDIASRRVATSHRVAGDQRHTGIRAARRAAVKRRHLARHRHHLRRSAR